MTGLNIYTPNKKNITQVQKLNFKITIVATANQMAQNKKTKAHSLFD